MQVNGIVTNVRKNAFTSKAGKQFTTTIVQIDTFDQEIDLGFKHRDIAVGHPLEGTLENKYNKWSLVDPNKQPASAPPATNGGGVVVQSGAKPYPLPIDHADNTFINQNSMRHAAVLVSTLIENGFLGSTYSEDDVTDLTIRLATKFSGYSSGRLLEEKLNALSAVGA